MDKKKKKIELLHLNHLPIYIKKNTLIPYCSRLSRKEQRKSINERMHRFDLEELWISCYT